MELLNIYGNLKKWNQNSQDQSFEKFNFFLENKEKKKSAKNDYFLSEEVRD